MGKIQHVHGTFHDLTEQSSRFGRDGVLRRRAQFNSGAIVHGLGPLPDEMTGHLADGLEDGVGMRRENQDLNEVLVGVKLRDAFQFRSDVHGEAVGASRVRIRREHLVQCITKFRVSRFALNLSVQLKDAVQR